MEKGLSQDSTIVEVTNFYTKTIFYCTKQTSIETLGYLKTKH